MNRKLTAIYFSILFLLPVFVSKAQVVTVTNPTFATPAMSATYTSLDNAINALNNISAISGVVTITLNPSNQQTAPDGGYFLKFTALCTSAKRVIIKGNNNIVKASGGLTGGSLTDAIFKIAGPDYVTIQDFVMQENPSNTNTTAASNNMTEWGVALLCGSTGDGSQHNLIWNNTISLNKAYRNTFGIYSNTRHTSGDVDSEVPIINNTTAPNHANRIYSNDISNVNMGIAFLGSGNASFMDEDNDIGGSSTITGNNITNFGGLAAASTFISNSASCYGIFINHQKNDNTSYNTISSAALSGTSITVRGIYKAYSTTVPTGTFTSDINNNVITLNHGFSSGILIGISSEGISTSLATSTININANRFQNIAVNAINAATNIVGIENTSYCGTLNINSNIFRGNTSTATTGGFFAIMNYGYINNALNINSNKIGDAIGNAVSFSAATSIDIVGINTGAIAPAATLSASSNNFQGFQQAVTGTGEQVYLKYSYGTQLTRTFDISNNTFTNLVANTTGNVTFLFRVGTMLSPGGSIENCNNNRIVTAFSKPAAGGIVKILSGGGVSQAGTTIIQTGNNFSNITLTGSTEMRGWADIGGNATSAVTKIIEGNTFQNWSVQSSDFCDVITCDYGGTNSSISGNIISGITSRGGVRAINLGTGNNGNNQYCSNNNISGLTTTGTTASDIILAGIYSYDGILNVANFTYSNNIIHGLSSNINIGYTSGMLIGEAATINIEKNRIYDINGIASFETKGISIHELAAGSVVNITNNLIADLHNNFASGSIMGIYVESPALGTANLYNNTIRIENDNGKLSCVSLHADPVATNGMATLRNNIFVCMANYPATGAVLRRSAATLNNYSTNSANNIFYGEGTNAASFEYVNGVTQYEVAAFLSHVSPREAFSFKAFPVFISTDGDSEYFLRLDPLYNCNIFGKGNNSGVLVATDIDGETRAVTTPFIVDIGADEVKTRSSTWTGANGTGWSNALNWSPAEIPKIGYHLVSIPAAPANQPVIDIGETFQVKDLTIAAGASLTNRGTLKVSGLLTAPVASVNNLNAGLVTGSLELNGPCLTAQTLAGDIFIGNHLKDLKLSTNVAVSATAGQAVNVSGILGFGNVTGKTLTTGNNIVLKSTVDGTATVGNLTGNIISGQATVERYINTGLIADGRHGKSWQLLATPTTGQTIRQSWQENGATPNGFGTIIVGAGTGFDITTAIPSMKTYNPGSNSWDAVTNTNNALQQKPGYMIFVRGDRTVTTAAGTANPTTLRSKGTLFQPNNPPLAVAVTANKFQTFGNPYASRIDFSKVRTASTGIDDVFYVWDPLLVGTYGLGGYQTISGVAGYVPTVGLPPTGNLATTYYPAGVAVPYIESGQAVFVKGNGTGGNVNFNETVKADGSRLVNKEPLNNELPGRAFIFSSLFSAAGDIADGNIVAFENGLGNGQNENDAIKLLNAGENFGIMRNDSLFAIEARDEVQGSDTIFYHLQNLKQLPYQFRFAPVNMPATLDAYLIDRLTNISTPVSLTDSSFIDFSVTANTASALADRFMLVFKQSTIVPVKIIAITANRSSDQHSIMIQWKTSNELNINSYNVERSDNGITFATITTQSAINNNGGTVTYTNNDEQPCVGYNYYRIRVMNQNGQRQYSATVKVSPLTKSPSIAVFPNPVVDQKIYVRFVDQPKGNYSIKLSNAPGQLIYNHDFYIDQRDVIKTISLKNKPAAGTYQLSIVAADGIKIIETVFIK